MCFRNCETCSVHVHIRIENPDVAQDKETNWLRKDVALYEEKIVRTVNLFILLALKSAGICALPICVVTLAFGGIERLNFIKLSVIAKFGSMFSPLENHYLVFVRSFTFHAHRHQPVSIDSYMP